ncbi:MAG: oligosaccharide flippase family protein [Rhodothermales bacterium]|nr:oligosaccharide flippase family protein [Rhodothermales bacterium]
MNISFLRSRFLRQAATLLVGTGMAQLIPLLASPLLARLYDAQAFGTFGLFYSICSTASVLASGRYELAVLLPKSDQGAYNLVRVALLLAVGISAALVVTALFFREPLAAQLGEAALAPWLPWVSVGVMTTAGYQAFNYWMNRTDQYGWMASTRTLRSLVQAGGSIGLAMALGGAGGLVWGWLAGQVVGFLVLGIHFWRTTAALRACSTCADVKKMAARYIRFPLYSVPADTLNSIIAQLPIWILTIHFSTSVTGQVFFAQRILAAPLGMIGAAVGDVFKQRASLAFIEQGSSLVLWKKTLWGLVALAVPLGLVVVLGGPWLFATLFGDEWRPAGEYARLLSPFLMLSLIANPLSRILYVAEKQNVDLWWQIALFIVTFGALWLGSRRGDPFDAVLFYALAYSGMYLVYLVLSYRAARGSSV